MTRNTTPGKRILPRHENDFYITPPELVKSLLTVVPIFGAVFEPCAGDGAIAKVLAQQDCHVITNDISKNQVTDYHFDATLPDEYPDIDPDWIVTNPPYSVAHRILPIAWEKARVGIAMLLRLSYLEPCDNRADFLKQFLPNFSNVIIFNPRPCFRTDTKATDSVTHAWFVWRKCHTRREYGCHFSFITDWKNNNEQ